MGDHAEQVRRLFGRKVARWPDKYAPQGPLPGRLVQFAEVVRNLGAPGSELLDIGCGGRELARHLAVRDFRVSGCDIAPEMLRWARAAGTASAARWIKLDVPGHTLPFGTCSRISPHQQGVR